MKYTAEEVRDYADACRLAHNGPVIADMLTELAERIKADESAVPVGFVMEATATRHKFGLLTQDLPPGAELFTHPPAQAAQVDLRNSLLRGKAQNEEPRVRHLCNMGVGCEEAGICYAEANGQPEQCGRPTAEPVAKAWLCDNGHSENLMVTLSPRVRDACAALGGTITPLYAHPAPPINLVAVREVIASHINEAKNLRHDPESQDYLYAQAGKLEAAIKGEP